MLLTLATANDVYADFVTVMGWGALIIVVTMVMLGFINKGTTSEIRPATSIRIGVFAYLLLAAISYRATYGRFITADITAREARLHFAGTLYRATTLEREQIKEVTYGYPGKGEARSCYITFVTTSGGSYRSAPTEGNACKDYCAQISSLMGIQADRLPQSR